MTKPDQVSLADLLDTEHPPQLHVSADGAVTLTTAAATLTLANPDTVLRALSDLGSAASRADAQRRNALDARRRKDDAAKLEKLRERWLAELPDRLGLAADADGRTFTDPAFPGVRLLAAPCDHPTHRRGAAAAVLELRVLADPDTLVATLHLDEDGWASPRLRFDPLPSSRYDNNPLLPEDARRLRADNPWRTVAIDATAPVPALAKQMLAAANAAGDWVRRVEAAQETARQARAGTAMLAAEWRRKSRSKDRIPTAALNSWLDRHSHIQYDGSRYVTGGWRVAAVPIVAEHRPSLLDKGKNPELRTSVGVKELLYVVRLEYRGAAYRSAARRLAHLSFYDSDLEDLRAALPDCVARMPEDRKTIFIAYNSPAHLLELDAALAEWVLIGAGGEDADA